MAYIYYSQDFLHVYETVQEGVIVGGMNDAKVVKNQVSRRIESNLERISMLLSREDCLEANQKLSMFILKKNWPDTKGYFNKIRIT